MFSCASIFSFFVFFLYCSIRQDLKRFAMDEEKALTKQQNIKTEKNQEKDVDAVPLGLTSKAVSMQVS